MIVELYFIVCLDLAEMEPACVSEYAGEYTQDAPIPLTPLCWDNFFKLLPNYDHKNRWKVNDFFCKKKPDWRLHG